MNKLYFFTVSIVLIYISILGVFGQKHSPLSFRIYMQPQVSSLNPYDSGLISSDAEASPSFAFGIEATRNLTKHLEISIGYNYSSQAGNHRITFCDFTASNFFAPTGDRIIGGYNCPQPRGKFRLFKIPVSLGWRMVEKEKFMSRLSFGPQFQLSLDRSYLWLHRYNKFSLGFMTEWSNYFRISRNFSLVAGLRIDRSITAMDNNQDTRSMGNSLGLLMGVDYTIWTEGK